MNIFVLADLFATVCTVPMGNPPTWGSASEKKCRSSTAASEGLPSALCSLLAGIFAAFWYAASWQLKD